MPRTTISVNAGVLKKLKRLGFTGLSLNDLLDDLIDFAKENIDEFNEFLDERYDVEEGEE